MDKIQKFEDIVAWQKALLLTKQIYPSTGVGGFSKDFGLKDQIQRPSVSTMSNIAEGFDELYNGAIEVSRLISGFMAYLRESDLKGRKYR